MWPYVAAIAIVFFANVLPAFAPPTWSLLVFFAVTYDLEPVALIFLGVVSAATGRYVLALTFRRYRHVLPQWYLTNMENAATHVQHSSANAITLSIIFFISPLSSAQLFEAAGIMKNLALRPLIIAFVAGRTLTYSIYVYGAQALADTSVGMILTRNLRTPQGIAIEILMVAALVALGAVKWRPHSAATQKSSQ